MLINLLFHFVCILFFGLGFFLYQNPLQSSQLGEVRDLLMFYFPVQWFYLITFVCLSIFSIGFYKYSKRNINILSLVLLIILLLINVFEKNSIFFVLYQWKFIFEIGWIVTVLIMINNQKENKEENYIFLKYHIWLIVLALMVGTVMRMYKLGNLSYWWDERITAENIKNIVYYGIPKAPDQFDFYWRGLFYHYSTSVFALIGSLNEWWVRLPSVICGIGIVGLTSYMSYKVNKNIFWYVLLLEIFSSYNIEYSRFARFYILNAFLFLLAIIFTYYGFLKNKTKFKFLSILSYILMIYTVQVGQFFIVIYFSYLLIDWLYNMIHRIRIGEYFKRKYHNWLLFLILLVVAYFGNIFIVFFAKTPDYAYLSDSSIASPRNYSIFAWPDWTFASWINNNLYCFSVILAAVFLWIRQIARGKINYFLSFVMLISLQSLILLEIVNRGVFSSRILLFIAPLFDLLVVWFIYDLYKEIKYSKWIILGIVLLLWLGIKPYFWNIVNLHYGDDVTKDIFRSTDVAVMRSDEKYQYTYLNEKYDKNNDIWIATTQGSPYVDFRPDYIVNQNYRWNTYTQIDEYGNYRDQYGSIVFNDTEKIKKIIAANSGKKIFITVNGSDIDLLNTSHLDSDFIDFINGNNNKVVFNSDDRLSKVLLFSN